MKNVMYLLLITLSVLGCNSKSSTNTTVSSESVTTETATAAAVDTTATEKEALRYACPMHPEVTGNKGDKCSKCGMALTEPVK